jgi:uncharacterized membrane protein
MVSVFRSGIVTAFFLLYPYLVFRGIQEGIVWFAPLVIASIFFYQGLREERIAPRVKKLFMALALVVGIIFFQSITAKLLPTLIQLILMYFFYKTLIHGPPLIERFVRLEFSELPAGVIEYCRQLTIVWTGFFGFNALICSSLALWGQASWWAVYSGIIIFLLTGVLMIGEYIFRHFKFPDMEIPDLKTSARNMVVNARQIWQDLYAG